ncbi:superoxide dismutase family protein [Modestobacter italicus]|uniref:superoxide dismutase family protein n=1 Tax=Modestobacter italicus (strain DSM 44449 / CECT 9708 / BC 501) TaxID=2732864 RepID=UPI001C94AADD|nr:superoxide dismutase family protein [Modestobacter italicus]
MKRSTVLPAAALLLALAACGDDPTGAGGSFTAEEGEITEQPEVPVEETADLLDPEGTRVGNVTFTDAETGAEVQVRANGLPPGTHPLELYSTASCEAPATSDDPTDIGSWSGLGDPLPDTDLPELVVTDDGVGEISSLVGALELDDILDEDGTTLIVSAVPADPSATAEAGADEVTGIACAAVTG